MSNSAANSKAERENGTRIITNTILGAGMVAVLSAVYEYILSYNAGGLTADYQAFLIFITVTLSLFVVASKFGYVARSADTLSLMFIGFAIFLVSLFAYALFVAGTPEVVTRHTGWAIAILIIPFLTLERTKARRLGGALCASTGFLVIAHIVQRGANPFIDPGCADLVLFLFSMCAAMLLLDGFAIFREAAIKFHARTDVLEETAAAMGLAVERAEAAQMEAEKSIKLRETFLATMSHELRTPLNAIIGFSEVIKTDALGNQAIDQYRSYAHDIHQSGEHVLSLINQLLDYSRIQSGTFDMTMEIVSVEAIATQAYRMMIPLADSKGIRLVVDWSDNTKSFVNADRQALVQIALNLLGNAVKFTPPGGLVTLKIDSSCNGCVTLAVLDTGPGIPSDRLEEVQKPFVRLGDATLASETGTGLGLAIVSTLAAAMGARFTMESELGKGTVCRISLDAAVGENIGLGDGVESKV